MGGLFGGKTTQTSTTTPFSGAIADEFGNMFKTLSGRYSNDASSSGYGGQLTAPENSTQQAAVSGLAANANNQTLADYANGKYLDPSTNPYTQQYANELTTNANNQFKTDAAGIDSRFNNRGFYDSSAHASTLDRASQDANANLDNSLTNFYNQQYQSGVGNMLNAQGQQQSANNALLNAGNGEYDIANNADNANYQNYLAQKGFTQQDINDLLNYFQVGRNPSTTTTQTSNDGLGSVVGTVAGKYLSSLIA